MATSYQCLMAHIHFYQVEVLNVSPCTVGQIGLAENRHSHGEYMHTPHKNLLFKLYMLFDCATHSCEFHITVIYFVVNNKTMNETVCKIF